MYGSSRDYGFLPPQFTGDVQFFFGSPSGAGTTPQIWNKPSRVQMVAIWVMGPGGGGGGGFSAAAGSSKGGGAGGGCGANGSMLIPSMFLPDKLSIFVGRGGTGGAAGASGGAGLSTVVYVGSGLVSYLTIPNIITVSYTHLRAHETG
jgi:hypothetical protein